MCIHKTAASRRNNNVLGHLETLQVHSHVTVRHWSIASGTITLCQWRAEKVAGRAVTPGINLASI